MTRRISIDIEKWPLRKPFVIARGTRHETETVAVTIHDGDLIGRGEAVALPRYGESSASVARQIEAMTNALVDEMNSETLQQAISAGAARNAIDAALWDLEAKRTGQDVGQLSGLGWPSDIQTVQTISIFEPEEMGAEARELARFPVIKVKANAERIVERIAAVHENAPDARLVVDGNESWTIDILREVAPELARLGVEMIEQPLHANADHDLTDYSGPLPIYADEACHTCADLPKLKGKYQGINIKLDKTGGLTEAIRLADAGSREGFDIMLGCMVSTSLGIAPAMFLATTAKYVDIDAPALLAEDREHAIQISDGRVSPLSPELWGGGGKPVSPG
ncbi:N-acetyl-D-Glu racemase DgcA [Parasphingorhabdus sp.]|uniref:N-acetyl-D-Glu racemase DgcA n=1 Tax=Parasphingorhabdus sp. TaxID=2709688 RepID=UPI003267B024